VAVSVAGEWWTELWKLVVWWWLASRVPDELRISRAFLACRSSLTLTACHWCLTRHLTSFWHMGCIRWWHTVVHSQFCMRQLVLKIFFREKIYFSPPIFVPSSYFHQLPKNTTPHVTYRCRPLVILQTVMNIGFISVFWTYNNNTYWLRISNRFIGRV
jgi:hypothetical protein